MTVQAPPGSAGRRLTLYATVGFLGRAANAGLPTAILLTVLGAGGTTTDGSLVVASLTLVSGLAGPFVGAAIDRLEHPKRGYLLGIVVLLVSAALLAVGIGSWPAGLLVFVAGMAGLAHPVLLGAWSAQLRRIVPDFPAARAYSLDVGTYNAGDIIGPALAGVAYIFDASMVGGSALEALLLLYIGAAIALPFVPIPARSNTHEREPEPVFRMMRGLTIFWHSRSLRRTTIISTIGYMGIAGVVIAAPLLGRDLAGDAGMGALLLAVAAVGALTGSLIMSRRPVKRFGPGTLVVSTTMAVAIAVTLLAISPTFVVAVPFAFLLGLAEAPQLSSVLQVRDRESPAHMRGLVFVSATSLKTGAFALGSVIAAALAPGGWRVILMGSATLEVAAILIGLAVGGRRQRASVTASNTSASSGEGVA